MDYARLERELKKRTQYDYQWRMKQNDAFDERTNFIYKTYSLDSLLSKIEKQFKGHPQYDTFFNYALNRWYNFWSAKGVEDIFCKHANVQANINQCDRLVDFWIGHIPFDHKTSKFPDKYNRTLEYAQSHPRELIHWLYQNQSQQSRKHLKNRLFVVLYNRADIQSHWKLKAEILWLKTIIDSYLEQFSQEKLHQLHFGQDTIYADIIWAVKN